MSDMFVVLFVTGGVFVFGLVSVTTGSDNVVTFVGHNAVISLNVSQADGEFKVGVEVNNVSEYFFLNVSKNIKVNNSRTWYRDRYRVRGNINSSVFRLTLYNVTTEDAGIYECRKFDINQRVPGCEKLLIVAQNPSQPNISGPASAVSGENVTLTCSFSSRSLPPDHPPLTMTFTWRRNRTVLESGDGSHTGGGDLTITHISRENQGYIYTCQAMEEGLKSDWSRGHVLDVRYGPYTVQFNEHDDKVTATEGDPLTVRCSADCNPACTVTWWDTSRQRVTSGHREAVLSIPAVNRSLSDLYTCHVNNTHGNKSRNLKLDIQYPPSVKSFSDISINNITRKLDSVSFLCVVDGNSKPSVYLRHDLTNRTYPMTCETLSKSIYTSHQYYECTHTIENFDVFLHGAYSCRAEDTVGHVDSHDFVVTVPTESGVSNVVSTAVICSVLIVLVAVVLAILLYRHKTKKGKRPYRVGADKEDQLQQDPSHFYSKVNKRRRAGREVSDVYEPVKLDSPRQFKNWMYGARSSNERMVLINNSDHTPGVTNNCGKRNEDGLMYADLDLAQPTLVDGMPIIHSREEPVVYEDVDFFLTPGPQLPDKIMEVEEDDDCW